MIDRANHVPFFDRSFFTGTNKFTKIGYGGLGGKATGLLTAQNLLASEFPSERFPTFNINIPTLTVLTTDAFDRFMELNLLDDLISTAKSDDEIARAFQKAQLPPEFLGDLRSLTQQVKVPLAIRSSSLMEDALHEPFAGVYATKMIPNNQPSADVRFQKLTEAIKFVYASTFFRRAQNYLKAIDQNSKKEKMAVIIQEIVGSRFNDRFYPVISGVARSYNFYRSGKAKPEDGVVSLALGLGKTIVDGGVVWTYSPEYPTTASPFTIQEFLKQTQTKFWAVNIGKSPEYDPIAETEYLVHASLSDADYDNTLRYIASTYDSTSDRIVQGVGRSGPRIINFAPILVGTQFPLNELIRTLLKACQTVSGAPVEIEFAVQFQTRHEDSPPAFGFLQVRPMVVSQESIQIESSELTGSNVLLVSGNVMGNGIRNDIANIVYVRPDRFDVMKTRVIAEELAEINKDLVSQKRPYLLIGFGRWGSSEPTLGIPVDWSDITGARAIVESALPTFMVEASQGSHFFHNISSFQVYYFSLLRSEQNNLDWTWLNEQTAKTETNFVRHVELKSPLCIKVDGRTGKGVILKS
jgi:pyruvate phosphate dikinase-like enzyme